MHEIQTADVLEISKRLKDKGIPSYFEDNKFAAWCFDKTTTIFEQLKRFQSKLALPTGIQAKDFWDLNIKGKYLAAFCNLTPTRLEKNSRNETPAGIIFFNTFKTERRMATPSTKWIYNWDNVDQIADANYFIGHSSTDHFLSTFIQEFSHNAHINRASEKIGGDALVDKIRLFNDEKRMQEYRQKYGGKLSQICNHALENPLEAVACDMTRVITDVLDTDTLMPTRDPFIGTPYENLSFLQKVDITDYTDEQRPLKEILRRFWNGKFE
jgi:hypothetical protein